MNADRGSLLARLRPLLSLLWPHRGLYLTAIVIGIAGHAFMVTVAGVGAWLVGRAVTGASVAELRPGLVLLAVLVVPVAVAPWLDGRFSRLAGFRACTEIRVLLFAKFESLGPAYLLDRRSGDLSAAIMSDVDELQWLYSRVLSPLVVALTVPLGVTIALLVLHPALALALAPALVLLATVPAWMRRRAVAQGRRLHERLGELGADAVDTVQGLREIVVFDAKTAQLRRLARLDRSLRAAHRAHAGRSGLEHAAIDTISVLGMLAVLITAAVLVTNGRLELALYPLAVVLALTTFAPVVDLTTSARRLTVVAAAADRILDILTTPAPVVERLVRPPSGPIEPRVRFTGVSFGYAPELPDAVREVSFEIGCGETVALVGHSGAGKSTCAHLLLRLWDVRAGAITIGAHDVRDLPQDTLRQLVTLVPQDVYLFNISLRDNIRLARPEATDAEVEAAARAACADEFISGLPEGYDTSAGEFGSRFSGGQKQRIAIARAILKDAPILILDEAVSNLDVESEHEVAAAMAGARAGRTTLIVAHRLSTIRSADRVVVLEGGAVAESGTHAKLLARNSTYARLIAAQPSKTGAVSEADIAQFTALGFVRLAGWLSAEEVECLRAEAEQALLEGRDRSAVTGKVPMYWTQVALMAKNTPFSMSLLVDDPRFRDAATALLGRAVLPRPALATRQQSDTGWHSSWPEGPIGERVSFVHYFEPRHAETGALRYLPGTHHLPTFEPFATYLSEHCGDAAASIDQFSGVTIETMPGDVIAFDSRGLHASRGGKNGLQWNLPYTIDPADDTERTEYLDTTPGWYPIVDYPAGRKYPLYRDWAANEQHHAGRQATLDRLTQLGTPLSI